MSKKSPRIAIISGELSGDQYASDLVDSVRQRIPSAEFEGLAGTGAEAAGLSPWQIDRPKPDMWFTQILSHFRHFSAMLQAINNQLQQSPPDLLVLIDYGGLNLRVAKIAHQLGIPVFYYIPPKVWAWARWRMVKLKKYVNWVAPIYPFETQFFRDNGITSFLVKHPFIAKINHDQPSATDAIALLPGSRGQEIKHLLPIMLQTAYLLVRHHPRCLIRVFCAEPDKVSLLREHIENWSTHLPIELVTTDKQSQLQRCRAAVVCSGTAAFECAMLSVPMVIVYRAQWLNYQIGRLLWQGRWFGLPNLILQRDAIPELLQGQCQPERILQLLEQLMADGVHREQQMADLARIKQQMTEHADCQSIGHVVADLL